MARSWVRVDDRTAAWTEAGDLILARDEGLIESDQPTLFKTVGVAVQDAVAAAAVLEEATRRGLGTIVTW